jgi:hypothetical protein
MPIHVAVPSDRNIMQTEAVKKLQRKNLVALYGTIYTNKIDNNIPAFVYLAKASLHIRTLTRSSS